MPKVPTLLTPPTKLPKVPFLTEAQVARLVKVSPETLRAWRRRGEMPPVAVGPARDEFVKSLKIRARHPIVYRCSDVSAWLFGTSGDGRPPALPASAFDPANDQTMQLRRAGQAAKNAGDTKKEARVRRLLTMQAKFAARLGFASPTEYEDWLARGAPEDELPTAVRDAREAALRENAEPAIDELVEPVEQREVRAPEPARSVQPVWQVLDEDVDPFAVGRSTRRRPSGYFTGG
jgi:hypothetical protein